MTSSSTKLHRQAIFTTIAAFCLIIAGGLVTSRDAGLAVPDWPLAFGELNPPRWWQIDNVRTEHGHRILAFVVASLTGLLAWRIRSSAASQLIRRLGLAAAGLVLLQALLGGLRVLHLSVDLAMIHGWLGQIFFAVLVAITVVTSPAWESAEPRRCSQTLRRTSVGLVSGIILQLVLGIWIRHQGALARPLLENGVFYAHVITATAVVAAALQFVKQSARRTDTTAHLARIALGLVGFQFLLGAAAWLITETMAYDRQATFLESWVPTAHVATGAALLATTLAASLFAHRGGSVVGLPARQDVADEFTSR